MNSFKNVRDAIEHEIKRQAALLDRGERVVQETRLWDAARGVTQAMRSKEQAHDYRYFPEPDLPPLVISDAELARLRAQPARAARGSLRALHRRRSGSSPQDAGVLVAERDVADYFDAGGRGRRAGQAGRQLGHQRGAGPRRRSAPPRRGRPAGAGRRRWPSWSKLVENGTLSGKLGKDVFAKMWDERRTRRATSSPPRGWPRSRTAASSRRPASKVVAANPDEAARFRAATRS